MDLSLGQLLTFGYTKVRDAAGLTRLVTENEIALVVDVRLRRYSWLAPFSWGTSGTFRQSGIAYAWVPDLGNRAYKTSGIEIASIEAIEPAVVAPLLAGRSVALMCACFDPATCHRRTIADEAVRRLPGLVVRDL